MQHFFLHNLTSNSIDKNRCTGFANEIWLFSNQCVIIYVVKMNKTDSILYHWNNLVVYTCGENLISLLRVTFHQYSLLSMFPKWKQRAWFFPHIKKIYHIPISLPLLSNSWLVWCDIKIIKLKLKLLKCVQHLGETTPDVSEFIYALSVGYFLMTKGVCLAEDVPTSIRVYSELMSVLSL